jgi:diketogulonate reductase-like aldo/keto reductase
LLSASAQRERAFVATKVWTTGREAGVRQMQESMRQLSVQRVDLMQIHNLVDWRVQLATLRDWKAQGRIRYLGITHYTASAYADVEAVLRAEPLDFLQINYSLEDRAAEQRLLPLARERGVAVLVNVPLGGGGLVRRLQGRALPGWAGQIGCTTWSQLLLKFVLGHPAVTCAIPGSSRAQHMASNALAGSGELPPPDYWSDKVDAIVL